MKNFIAHCWTNALFLMVFSACVLAPALVVAQSSPEEMRTLFVIGDIGDAQKATYYPILAYIVYGNELILAETWWVQYRLGGPVGLAVDQTNELLFVSYEELYSSDDDDDFDAAVETGADAVSDPKTISDSIDIFNARDGTFIRTLQLPGTSNLCGMVVHQERGHLYVVDRGDLDVWVFDINAGYSMVDHWVLPAPGWWPGAWGISLIGDELYVTGNGEIVRYYDIDSHLELGNFTLTRFAVAIAGMDHPTHGPLIYTTQYNGGIATAPYMTRWEVNTGAESIVDIGMKGKGVALNPALELAYVVRGNSGSQLKVYDSENLALLNTYALADSRWSPTDIEASTIPFGGTVSKTSPSHPNGHIPKGDQADFDIAIENRSAYAINYLPLKDTYDNTHLHFVSATPAAVNSVDDGQINWNDLTVSFGGTLAPGATWTVRATFEATDICDAPIEDVNLGQVEGATDTRGNEIWAAGVFDYVIDCICTSDPECDDGQFCNGVEKCDDSGNCVPATVLPCPDDLQYCNGEETCNETADSCEHSGDPCVDDGVFCNGAETCAEASDECVSSGNPCASDGQYCNGAESCDEAGDTCESTGNPCADDGTFCNGVETCDEVGDDCISSGNPCPDDGLYCNGQEVCEESGSQCIRQNVPDCQDDGVYCNGAESCNEETDECGSTGDPCEPDGSFCNGVESCDETGKSCIQSDVPSCEDDGLFCNGPETCSDKESSCIHLGDPCPPDTTCNEQTDMCDKTEETPEPDDDDSPKEGDEQPLWPEGEVTGGCCGC